LITKSINCTLHTAKVASGISLKFNVLQYLEDISVWQHFLYP